MALAQSLLCLGSLIFFCAAFACCGRRILKYLDIGLNSPFDQLLISTAVGIVCAETLLLLGEFSQHIRPAAYCIVGLLSLCVLIEAQRFGRQINPLFRRIIALSGIERFLFWLTAAVILVEFLIASAPLTGSDAQHYHFTVQKLILDRGFHPLFSITTSFLCGQHHSLILFGLALGSERLALGFIFLGGVLSAAVAARLSAQWVGGQVALVAPLLFLLTPVVFWQMSNSGSPDIFMAFFLGTVLILLNQRSSHFSWRFALTAGWLTGGVAGGKYSGCLIAAAVLVVFVWQFRSFLASVVFVLSAVFGGISPYLRNTIWTGNPVFPFLAQKLSPHLVTGYAMRSLALSTGAAQHHSFLGLLPFALFAQSRPDNIGLWDFFGPTVLAMSPPIFIAIRKNCAWQNAVVVWLISAVALYFSSGLLRFLLPIYPVALACAAASVAWIHQKELTIAKSAVLTLFFFVAVTGFAGLMVYGEKPIEAALGLKTRESYLKETSQEYEVVEAINNTLGNSAKPGRTLVFVRHLYYLRVPFVNGDPENSFEIDPGRLNTVGAWKDYFRAQHIAYVARGAQYPAVIASPLIQMEKEGDLVRIAELHVDRLQGKRIDNIKVTVPVLILKVNDEKVDPSRSAAP